MAIISAERGCYDEESKMKLTDLPITHQATIPESYIDSMGHMNVMWYTSLFGKAMGGIFNIIGLNKEYYLAHHCGAFALQQFFDYRKEVRVGEAVTIRSRVLGRSDKRLHIMHFMAKGDSHVLACTCEVICAHIDMNIRRTSPFKPELAESIDRIIAEHAALNWDAPVSGAMKV